MKSIFFFLFFSFANLYSVHCQSYLGYINHSTELIDSNRTIIKNLGKGDAIFLISLDTQEGHYNVVDIKSNKEGFVQRKDIVIERVIPQVDGNVFSAITTSELKDPIIKVYNNSKYDMTVKINNVIYALTAKEKKTIHLQSGRLYYRVSSAQIQPYYGTEPIENFHLYEWEFYIGDM